MSTTPTKISIAAARELDAAIRALDGAPKVIGTGDKEHVVYLPYKLKPQVRVSLAQNKIALKPILDAFETEHSRVFNEVSPTGAGFPNESPLKWKYDTAMKPTLDSVHDVELIPITLADLELDSNNITASVLEAMQPILDL